MHIGQTTTVGTHNHQKFQYTQSNKKEDFLLALPIQAILPTNIPWKDHSLLRICGLFDQGVG